MTTTYKSHEDWLQHHGKKHKANLECHPYNGTYKFANGDPYPSGWVMHTRQPLVVQHFGSVAQCVLAQCYKKAFSTGKRKSQRDHCGFNNKSLPKKEQNPLVAILRELPLATREEIMVELWFLRDSRFGNEVFWKNQKEQEHGLFGVSEGILLDEFKEWSLTYSLSNGRELPDLISPTGTVIQPADFNFLVTRGGQSRRTGPQWPWQNFQL